MLERFWQHLGITQKFSLIFSVILGFIVLLTALSYSLLLTAHRKTVSDIETSYRIQNLVLDMDRDMEKARRIKLQFSLAYLQPGVNASNEKIAQQVRRQLTLTAKQSESLQKLISRSNVSQALKKSHININLYYSMANRCLAVFRELSQLVQQLEAPGEGLEKRLQEVMTRLATRLEALDNPVMSKHFNQLELMVKEYFLTRKRPFMQSALNQAFFIQTALQDDAALAKSATTELMDLLADYTRIAAAIPNVDVTLQTKSREFDLNAATLEPISSEFVELARQEIVRAQTENAHIERLIMGVLIGAAIAGFALIGMLAYVIHVTITRNIVRLTQVAARVQAGHFEVPEPLHSHDELGRLSEGFSQMTLRLKALVDGLEEQVKTRTKDLSASNRSLRKEIAERKSAELAKRKLEADLRQSQKMEAIGTLAGGIAHDFNNILGIIIGNCELAVDDIPEGNPAFLNLKEIKTASLRARDIVRQLLSFSRKTEHRKIELNLAPLLTETLNLLRATIPKTIEIQQFIPKDLPAVEADPSQIHQVILNLCTNAAHAMEADGGVLEIRVRKVMHDAETAPQFDHLTPGPYLQLDVNDTGPGISPEITDRIFDPYFTTKAVGKGSGMGLAIVHGIIKNHDGSIRVYSEPGRGTTFKVLLPALAEGVHAPEPPPGTMPMGDETLLFVDDEKAIAAMARDMLKRLGYRVDVHTDPVEALENVRTNPDKYDLVITDMTMPQMSGESLARQIMEIRSSLPVILCSGFSAKMDKERALSLGIRDYIEKPLDRMALSKAVRAVLDGESPGTG